MEKIRPGEDSPSTAPAPASAAPQRGDAVPAEPDSFLRKVVTVVAVVSIAGSLLALLVLGIDILLAVFAGVLIAVLLHAFSDFVTRHTPLSYRWALTVVVLLLLLFLGVCGWLLAPQIAEQADQLRERLPAVIVQIERYLNRYGWGQWLLERARTGPWLRSTLRLDSGVSVVSQWLSYAFLVLSVGLFVAANPRLYVDGVVHLFPLRERSRIRRLMDDLGHTLRWWLIGQAITMVLIGVSTALVIWALGLQLAIVLGLIVGLVNFIPYLGPLIGAVPIAIVAVPEGASQLLYVMLAYSALQTLEGYIATPVIQHRMVYLPPALTLTIQILLGAVLGALGIMFATPLAAVMLVLTRFYRVELLGDAAAAKDEGPGR